MIDVRNSGHAAHGHADGSADQQQQQQQGSQGAQGGQGGQTDPAQMFPQIMQQMTGLIRLTHVIDMAGACR